MKATRVGCTQINGSDKSDRCTCISQPRVATAVAAVVETVVVVLGCHWLLYPVSPSQCTHVLTSPHTAQY